MKEPIKDYKPAEKLELPKVKKEFPKVFKKIICPSCKESVNADQLNLEKSIAKCGSCHVVFSIEEELSNLNTKNEIKQEVFRPEGIDLFYYKDDMEITLDGHVNQWDIVWFTLFLPGFIFTLIAYFNNNLSILVPLILFLGSILFLYRLINYKKNSTYIDVNKESIRVNHRTNNLKKDVIFSAEDIDQVYLKHSSTQGGYFELKLIVNGPQGQYHKNLLTVNTLTKAKYLEQEIEKYLGIEDRKVIESTV